MPLRMLDNEILIHIPFIPKGLINNNANGILSAVNIMLILAEILGFPIPVNKPFDIISTALNICEKATTFKYDAAITMVASSLINKLINGLLNIKNTHAITIE